jgi:hypothetical protein
MSIAAPAPEPTPLNRAGSGAQAQSGAKLPDRVKGVLAALGGLAIALISLLTAFGAVSWSPAQTGLATAEVAAVLAFLSACVAHFWRSTPKEPVAVGGTLTALVAATLASLSGFNAWTLSQTEMSALVGVVTAFLAVAAALIARTKVSPTSATIDG